jgi:hypothetical protein
MPTPEYERCEAAMLREDFRVPLTFAEFCVEENLPCDDSSNLAYREYYASYKEDD